MNEQILNEILTTIKEFREENNKRWEENDKKWEENDRKWKENDKKWNIINKRIEDIINRVETVEKNNNLIMEKLNKLEKEWIEDKKEIKARLDKLEKGRLEDRILFDKIASNLEIVLKKVIMESEEHTNKKIRTTDFVQRFIQDEQIELDKRVTRLEKIVLIGKES